MYIQVERIESPEGNLVFTVTVSDPHHSCFGEEEIKLMKYLDTCKKDVEDLISQDNKNRAEALTHIHEIKEKVFVRVLDNLKFEIENEFRPRFKPICQEIYNWIYHHQKDELKSWMSDFDPQRTRYFFDNDPQLQAQRNPVASVEDVIEIEVDEED